MRQGSKFGFAWAPVFVCHGHNNRTNMIHVPTGSGLEGIREGPGPGEPHRESMYLHR